jgi:tetratricopeptide (TPR) repeat protein
LLGYIAGITLVLFILFAAVSLFRVFTSRSAAWWGKVAGTMALLFTVAFILWISVEIPAYERQQAKILYQMGQNYLAAGDYPMAYDSFVKISKADKETHALAQTLLDDLRGPLAAAKLEEAQTYYASGQYSAALDALKISITYYPADESKALLPTYQKAAGRK